MTNSTEKKIKDKNTLKAINSTVNTIESVIRFLPGNLHHQPIYEASFGGVAAVIGGLSIGQALTKKDAFKQGNRLNTAIIITLGLASVLQGMKKMKQAYAKKTGQYDLVVEEMTD
jgi:hypothetical protein